jgi:hypothetical protein
MVISPACSGIAAAPVMGDEVVDCLSAYQDALTGGNTDPAIVLVT